MLDEQWRLLAKSIIIQSLDAFGNRAVQIGLTNPNLGATAWAKESLKGLIVGLYTSMAPNHDNSTLPDKVTENIMQAALSDIQQKLRNHLIQVSNAS